jgi:hypothetical protein
MTPHLPAIIARVSALVSHLLLTPAHAVREEPGTAGGAGRGRTWGAAKIKGAQGEEETLEAEGGRMAGRWEACVVGARLVSHV